MRSKIPLPPIGVLEPELAAFLAGMSTAGSSTASA
jgi:hypothetical protein